VPITIVVVDDDPEFLQIIRAIVTPEAESIRVVGEAENGEGGARGHTARAP
jgi:YesN/AraC family two-component response regulator